MTSLFDEKKFKTIWLPLILGACLLANVRVLKVPFLWDDEAIILRHSQLRSAQHWRELAFEPVDRLYRPVRSFSYFLDFKLFGENAEGFHASQLIYHLLATAGAALLAFRLFPGFAGVLAGLLFAAHPIHTENAAWLSGGRADLLAMMFSCFSLLALRPERRESPSALQVAASLVLFLLALGSKEAAATLPALLFLWFWTQSGARHAGADLLRAFRRSAPHFAALAAYLIYRFAILRLGAQVSGMWSMKDTLLMLPPTVAHYARLLAFPAKQCAVYVEAKDLARADGAFYLALAGIAAACAAAWAMRKKAPAAFFGIGWFFISLAPVSNLIPIATFKAERFLYAPSLGAFLAAGGALEWLARKFHPATLAIRAFGLAAALCLACLTFSRLNLWTDNYALWQATAACAPDSPLALNNFANANLERNNFREAVEGYNEALRLDPNQPTALANLGRALEYQGRFSEAIDRMKESWRLEQSDPSVAARLAHLLERTGNYGEAAKWYETANRAVGRPVYRDKIEAMKLKADESD